jgi:predicted NBD/HSP70 family sugar kinase
MRRMNDVKTRNILDVVKEIRYNGLISKPMIARNLGLTGASVHNFIKELQEHNVVIEEGIAQSNGGRKAALYKLNPKFGYLVGQNLDIEKLTTCVFDLNLNLLYESDCFISSSYNHSMLDMMADNIVSAVGNCGIRLENCFGIGISVPGQVDYYQGVIKNIPHMNGWNGIPIKEYLEKKTGARTFVDNDTNNFALVGKWMDDIPYDGDSVALSIAHGVGVGVLTKGAVFRGANSNAGEIGHTTILYNGPKCSCGNHGCLDILLSEHTIIQKISDRLNGSDYTIRKIVEMMKGGDQAVGDVLNEIAAFIAIAIDHVIKVYDPGYIIVYSNWLWEFPDICNMIIDTVFARTSWIARDELQIKFSDIKSVMRYSGVVQVLEYIFSTETENFFLPV